MVMRRVRLVTAPKGDNYSIGSSSQVTYLEVTLSHRLAGVLRRKSKGNASSESHNIDRLDRKHWLSKRALDMPFLLKNDPEQIHPDASAVIVVRSTLMP